MTKNDKNLLPKNPFDLFLLNLNSMMTKYPFEKNISMNTVHSVPACVFISLQNTQHSVGPHLYIFLGGGPIPAMAG